MIHILSDTCWDFYSKSGSVIMIRTCDFNQYVIMYLNCMWWLTFVSWKDVIVVRGTSMAELKFIVDILTRKIGDSFDCDFFFFSLGHLKWSYIFHMTNINLYKFPKLETGLNDKKLDYVLYDGWQFPGKKKI